MLEGTVHSGDGVPVGVDRLLGKATGHVRSISTEVARRQPTGAVQTELVEPALKRLLPGEYAENPSLAVSGKGVTARDGTLSAIGEYCERYCLYWPPEYHDLPEFEGSAVELDAAGHDWVSMRSLALYTTEQLAAVDRSPLTHTTPTRWVAGHDLTTGEPTYLPAELLFLAPVVDEPHFFPTTNGAACGPTTEAALLGSLYELIERDAVMRQWFTQRPPTRLGHDPDSPFAELRENHTNGAYRVELLDLDATIGFAVGAALVDPEDRTPKFLLAAGADLDPMRAAEDALIELQQGLRSLQWSACRDRVPAIDPAHIMNLEDNVEYYAQPEHFDEVSVYFEGPTGTLPTDRPTPATPREELAELLEAFAAAGLTPIAVDLTLPDIEAAGLVVTEAFVPEFVGLSLPSLPPANHPAFDGYSLTEKPHPFP
ncbi:MAG: YcaO-like family protein [Halobacteriales archaeon]